MALAAAQQIDANNRTISSNEGSLLENTWTFVEATTGAVGAHTLFTVTGNVLVSVFGVCDTDLVGAATLEVGVAGNTAGLIAQTANATTIDDGEILVDATSAVGVEALPGMFIVNDGADIIMTIGVAAVTAGKIDFYCLFRPLSADSSVSVTEPA